MSAIIEPEGATWWVSDRWAYKGLLSLSANREDRNLTIVRSYPPALGEPPLSESIELTLEQLPEVEAMLLNARLWLERATKQADGLKAAAEIAEDGPTCTICGHPFHGLKACDDCACPFSF